MPKLKIGFGWYVVERKIGHCRTWNIVNEGNYYPHSKKFA